MERGPTATIASEIPVPQTWQGDRRAWRTRAGYAMFVLFIVNLVGYLDRQVLSLLVQPIKQSLGLSDGMIGLVQGAAFVITFAIAGLFIGRRVDHGNRRNLMLLCIAIWTVGAAAGGFAQAGWQLFAARMAVGAGEAALVPCAISLISDFYPSEKRGQALGLFSMGIYAGAGLSLILVGFAMPSVEQFSLALAAQGIALEPWRIVLILLLAPGLVACLALATLEEPARRHTSQISSGSALDGFSGWWLRRRIYIPHHVGWAMANVCQYAITGWFPTVLIREYGYDAKLAGLTYGALIVIVGIFAAVFGGRFSDRAVGRFGPVGRIGSASVFIALAIAGFLLIASGHTANLAVTGAGCVAFGMGAMMVIGLTSLADLSPPQSRGQVSAIFLVIITIIGTAGGPAMVGYGNDWFGGPDVPLSRVLAWVGCISASVSIGLVLLTVLQIRRSPDFVRDANEIHDD
ncbi:major facilitator transporter [Novosphingobium sp. PY1]|nr:major facilitator transporter [Novosphingobium sp. PY1]